MSKIILQSTDFSTLGFPTGEFFLAVDAVDGLLKLRRQTDTIILGATNSNFLEYNRVTFSTFVNLINTSLLKKGNFYIVTDYATKHYIQYTDSNGNGTSGDEEINTGLVEELLILATSENTYDNNVKSLQYPSDSILWKHNPSNRESDWATGGTGLIYFRKSESGNSRDYDFRSVVFRRWNDGLGNYNIYRAVDSPGWPGGLLVLDFIDFKPFSESFEEMKMNLIGSLSGVPNLLGVPYYLDNFVFKTFSQALENKIYESHGVTVDALDFSSNTIDVLHDSTFINQTGTFNYNKISQIKSVVLEETFEFNGGFAILSSTFSNFSYNKFGKIENCDIDYFTYNNLISDLNSVTTGTFSFRIVSDAGSFSSQNYLNIENNLGTVFHVSSNGVNPSLSIGTNSSNSILSLGDYTNEWVNLSDVGTFSFTGTQFNIVSPINIGTISSSTSSTVLVLENNLVKFREIELSPGIYNVNDITVATYSATVSNFGKDYFGVVFTQSSVTINLPSISGIITGKAVTIKDETGAASVNPITIITSGLETIDGFTQSQLAINYGSLTLIKKPSGWWII